MSLAVKPPADDTLIGRGHGPRLAAGQVVGCSTIEFRPGAIRADCHFINLAWHMPLANISLLYEGMLNRNAIDQSFRNTGTTPSFADTLMCEILEGQSTRDIAKLEGLTGTLGPVSPSPGNWGPWVALPACCPYAVGG
jgi:hypothetical protein